MMKVKLPYEKMEKTVNLSKNSIYPKIYLECVKHLSNQSYSLYKNYL